MSDEKVLRPTLDLEWMHKGLNELDTGDADHFEMVWWAGNRGPQPVIWSMRMSPLNQGNMSSMSGNIYGYSPRVH